MPSISSWIEGEMRQCVRAKELGIRRDIDPWALDLALNAILDEIKEAKDWLRACLGLVEGSGPPNWDGIREFLKRD